MNRSLTTLSLMACTLLAGCASQGPVPTLYDFGPSMASPAANSQPPLAALIIADATGPSWLDSQKMYYRLLYADAQQARPYAHNHWNATPLQLLSQRLKSRIAQTGVKVLSSTDAATGAMLLRIEIDDFSQNFDAPSRSSAHIALRVSAFYAHRLIDQQTFSSNTSAASADAAGGAKALAATTDALAKDIIGWLAALPPQKE